MRFFTADTHFGHQNLIEYDKRPFKTSDEMDTFIIKRWNETVSKQDIIYHLGDFCWRGSKAVKEILQQLNGQIHLIEGNHDKLSQEIRKMFASVSQIKRIRLTEATPIIRIVLCHYSLRTWVGKEHGVWQLYGHSHGRLTPVEPFTCDVGINMWNWKPVSFEKLQDHFAANDVRKEINGNRIYSI